MHKSSVPIDFHEWHKFVSPQESLYLNHVCNLFDPSSLMKTVVSLLTLSRYWFFDRMMQKQKCGITTNQIFRGSSIIMDLGKATMIFVSLPICLKIECTLDNFEIFRKQSLHTLKSRVNPLMHNVPKWSGTRCV